MPPLDATSIVQAAAAEVVYAASSSAPIDDGARLSGSLFCSNRDAI
jgi:hypothetical protein